MRTYSVTFALRRGTARKTLQNGEQTGLISLTRPKGHGVLLQRLISTSQ
jgi:hypothetical protein